MDNIKIGRFIAELRKEKNLTQKELADKLFVSDRAISKWENGRGIPDISIISKLAEELEVNISEILAGDKLGEINKNDSNNMVKESIFFFQKNYFKNKIVKILISLLILIVVGVFTILFVGEITDGSITLKSHFYKLPSFSEIKADFYAKKFLKALKNENYQIVKDVLIANPYIEYSSMNNSATDMDLYLENLKYLKNNGVSLNKYTFRRCDNHDLHYACEYDLEFEYNNEIFYFFVQLSKLGGYIITTGYGWNYDGNNPCDYQTVEDYNNLKKHLYLNLD